VRAAARALGLAAALAAAPAAAGELIWPEPGAERRMLLAEEAVAYQAVGRLNIAGRRFCTATMVSEREVLTAAHCLFHPRTGKAVPLTELRFVPGHRLDRNLGVRQVLRAATPPGFAMVGRPTPADLAADIALVELDAPADAVAPPPFRVGPLRADDAPTTIVSYARDRAEAPSISDGCPPLGLVDAVLVINCAVERGVSGAPVLAGTGPDVRLVAVVSGMGAVPDGGEFALAVPAEPWLAELRAQLAGSAAAPGPLPRPSPGAFPEAAPPPVPGPVPEAVPRGETGVETGAEAHQIP
jgi:hypothetical protein